MSATLCAGVAQTSITPSLGIRLAGYTVQQDFANDVHSELLATAIWCVVCRTSLPRPHSLSHNTDQCSWRTASRTARRRAR